MPPAKTSKTSETFTAEEQKQFDGMRDADKGDSEPVNPPPVEAPPTDADSKPADNADTPPSKSDQPPAKETKELKEPKENTMVPHAALEAERQKRKAAEQRERDREIEFAKVQERLNVINQALEAQHKAAPKPENTKPEKMEIPDPEKDALGAVKALTHNIKMTEQENRLLQQAREQREADEKVHQENQKKAETENARIRAELARASSEESEFATRTPDFQDAANHLRAVRRQQLQLMGFTDQPQYDPQTYQVVRPSIEFMIGQDLLQMARNAQMLNTNAGEFLYNMSKASGYQTKAAPPANNQPAANSQPAPASTSAQPSVAEQIDKLNAGQRANRSLSEAQGNAPAGKINAKDLATMSDAQFAKMVSGMSQQEQYEYFGN